VTQTLQSQIATLHADGQGKGYRQIARELGISPHAARKEIEAIKARETARLPSTIAALVVPPEPPRSMLQVYDSVCRLLAEATLINDVLPLLDQIEHVKLHAKKVRDRRAVGQALALQQRAERRLGEIIIAARENRGHFTQGHRAKKSPDELLPRATLAEVGVNKALSTRAQKLAAVPRKAFEDTNREIEERIASGAAKLVDREAVIAEKKERRTSRERILGLQQQALPQGKFGVILADPEWRFEPWSRATGMDRSADNHYPTSCTEIIAERDVASIAADDAVLFLWATNPMLPHALLVMGAWGFDYRSQYCWGKDKAGTGYWSREKHETLLLGIKGNIPCPAPGTQWDSLIMAPRGAHSAKPECFLEMIEQYFPTLPKIELNRRGPARDGWSAWGNETQQTEAAE
jgi:N6-adenosine-specific RNA methylase IME4